MSDELAEQLLNAQVAFERRKLLDPQAFHELVVEEVDQALDDANRLTLGEVVSAELIKDVAYKYAVQMPLEGAIPELAGEVAARIYRHPANDEVRVAEVMGESRFDDLATAIAEMDATRRIITEVLEDPLTLQACVEVITRAFDNAVIAGAGATHQPGVRAAVRGGLWRLVGPVLPTMEAGVEKMARAGTRYVLRAAAEDGEQTLLDSVRETWRSHAEDSVGSFRQLVTADDVEDVVVVVFEFWRSFRHTDYFRALLHEGIDHVFDKYGQTTLTDLLADLGIGRADLIEEGIRFGTPVLAELDSRGLVEAALRRRLRGFYNSPEFHAIIAAS